jgi:hypothetical protein
VELVEQRARLRRRAVLENTLENATSVRMRGEAMNLADAGFGDEDNLVARDALESALRRREKTGKREAREQRDERGGPGRRGCSERRERT